MPMRASMQMLLYRYAIKCFDGSLENETSPMVQCTIVPIACFPRTDHLLLTPSIPDLPASSLPWILPQPSVFDHEFRLFPPGYAPARLCGYTAHHWTCLPASLNLAAQRALEVPTVSYLFITEVWKNAKELWTLTEAELACTEDEAKALKTLKFATLVISEEKTPTLSVIAALHAQL
ncbi:unnamed protein product [Pleuronectes platessa]|uniref:Uncharacterized protein n=1 Tax=Pleuronectes platessa TaxID=8262 RepID=A0A9N7UUG5_PLEPL|nr:unnamed protein product [Pleuronectes platessa]